jgi:hypothetical protein
MDAVSKTGKIFSGKLATIMIRIGVASPLEVKAEEIVIPEVATAEVVIPEIVIPEVKAEEVIAPKIKIQKETEK